MTGPSLWESKRLHGMVCWEAPQTAAGLLGVSLAPELWALLWLVSSPGAAGAGLGWAAVGLAQP